MKTILQVEDDANDVFFFQRAMKKAGANNPIQVATDGQQAIDYLKGSGKYADRVLFPLPSLVLLDLKLPHVMGLEVLRWIRQQPGPVLPVVILSASGEWTDISAAYQLGANAVLMKPSEADKLDEMARSIKDFWLTHNTLPPFAEEPRAIGGSLVAEALKPVAPAPTKGPARHAWLPSISRPTYPRNTFTGL
jgi:CheY-like chemotaxis protein